MGAPAPRGGKRSRGRDRHRRRIAPRLLPGRSGPTRSRDPLVSGAGPFVVVEPSADGRPRPQGVARHALIAAVGERTATGDGPGRAGSALGAAPRVGGRGKACSPPDHCGDGIDEHDDPDDEEEHTGAQPEPLDGDDPEQRLSEQGRQTRSTPPAPTKPRRTPPKGCCRPRKQSPPAGSCRPARPGTWRRRW